MIYLSLWIANFGVVPWLSFLFFLFLPAFLAFIALLVLVTCVLEAILFPFLKSFFAKIMQLRTRFLSSRPHIVKVFLLLGTLNSALAGAKGPEIKEYFLAKGEQIEIKVENLASFSVGNKEVLKSKFYAAKSQLLVKGQSLGFSDLVVWSNKGEKISHHFYVVSKKDQLTNLQLANDFKSLGLEVKALAFELLVKGELKSIEDLRLFNMYMEKNKDRVINMVDLSQELRNEVIANIYLELSDEAEVLICSAIKTSIECMHEGLNNGSSKLKRLEHKYSANFIPRAKHFQSSNFKVELKVLRTDQGQLENMGLGLDKLSAKVGDLLNRNEKSLVESNQLLFSEKELSSNIVTSPSILTSLGVPGEIQLGAEIPVVNQNQYGSQSTTWKFAGLKLKTLLSLGESKVKLSLENELTHPVENLIRGSKSKTEFFPKLGEYVQAFSVKYDLNTNGKKRIPGLSLIPILSALFTSTSNNTSSQWLVGYVKITRIEP